MAEPDAATVHSAPTTSNSYDGLTFQGHMLAGAAAGIGEHVVMYPVDTIKTRMQALAHPGQQLHTSVGRALTAVLRREGVTGVYRGVTAMVFGAGPSHAVYFACYEAAKELYCGNAPGHHPFATAAAGMTATLVNDASMTPWDVVKQRMQVSHSPYRSVLHCISATLKHDGLAAFYRSYWTTVVMNMPYTAIHFATYESLKKSMRGDLHKHATRQTVQEGFLVQFIAGGLAGGLAAGATTPLDVVKTRLQLEGVGNATRYRTMGVVPVLQRILREEGSLALWRGWQPRMLFHAPSAAICWTIYETCKRLLG